MKGKKIKIYEKFDKEGLKKREKVEKRSNSEIRAQRKQRKKERK